MPRSLLSAVALLGGRRSATFAACYVPDVGAPYLINQTGLPAACPSTGHVAISWTECTDHGALAGLADGDHAQYLLVDGVRDGTDGFAVTRTLNEGVIPVSALVEGRQDMAEYALLLVLVGMGVTAPTSDMKRSHDAGWRLRGGIGLSFPRSPVTVRADGEYHRLPEVATADNTRILGGSLNAMIDVVRLGTGGQIHVVGGAGYYSLRFSDAFTAGGPADVADVGLQGGLCLTIGASRFGGMIEAKFVRVFHEGSGTGSPGNLQYVPITVGIKF